MSLIKTLDPAGVLVAINGNECRSQQAIEDLVDAVSPLVAAATSSGIGTPTITVAVQASTHRDATIQLKDAAGVALAAKARAQVWISDTAAGALTAAAPAGGVTATTGIILISTTANKAFECVSDASGVITVRLTDATGSINTTWYVNVAFGQTIISAAVNITNA